MDMRITPSAMGGAVSAPPSKSALHRLLICAALADAPCEIALPQCSQDIRATLSCLSALGAGIAHGNDVVTITPIAKRAAQAALCCGESGSTLRFLLPLAAVMAEHADFSGAGRLPERPLMPLVQAMEAGGARFSAAKLPFTVSGGLRGGRYELPGDVSSQFISGLLLALPLLDDESTIRLSGSLLSAPYVDMTLDALSRFGIDIRSAADGYDIAGRQRYHAPAEARLSAEGDWSNAAALLAAGALGGGVSVNGLDMRSKQVDRRIIELLRSMGAVISIDGGTVCVKGSSLHGADIDIGQTPDLLPVLAVAAAAARGTTRFTHAARLRLKESDRLRASAALVRSLGGAATELPDGLVIEGSGALIGGAVDSFADHRLVMAAAAAAPACQKDVIIMGAEAVAKSYPRFFEDYMLAGGNANAV